MSNETTENFLKVMAAFEWPEAKEPVYRLYYNDDGTPKCYTMDDLPGKYITVDRDTYINHIWNVRVVDEKLQIVPIKRKVNKLSPSQSDGQCCHAQDICVVVGADQPHIKWNMKDHEVN